MSSGVESERPPVVCKVDPERRTTCEYCRPGVDSEPATIPPSRLSGEMLRAAGGLTIPIGEGKLVTITVCAPCASGLLGALASRLHDCAGWVLAVDPLGAQYRAFCACACDS